MKKYLYNIVLASLILMSTTVVKAANEVYYVNRNDIEMTEEEYNTLLTLGFTDKYIETMEEEEFIANKDLEATQISSSKKYIITTTAMRNGIKVTTSREVTKEEAEREVELQSQKVPYRGPAGNYYDGIVDISVFSLTTNITGLGNTYMRFMNYLEWMIIPSDRYYDIIGIGIESNKVQMATGAVFNEQWYTTDGVHGGTQTFAPKEISTGGLGIFKLPDGSIQTLYMSYYFNIMKKPNVGTLTSVYAYGDYAHAVGNVTPSNLLSHVSIYDSIGIVVDSTYSYLYLETPVAVASFQGTW